MNFDEIIDRRNTHSEKWDDMEKFYGVSPDDGLAMWVADMDFRPPEVVGRAVQAMVDHGVYGYFGDNTAYFQSICWWMKTRHGWAIDPAWVFSAHGLVNGSALCVNIWTSPGDAVLMFTPIYHSFARAIHASGRTVTECPLAIVNGRYEMDFEAAAACLTGREKMIILCSPHNPGGRVWSKTELSALADFCVAHDLLIVSDEIHHDLVYPGQRHTVMALAAPAIIDRLVTLTAPSKTFNIAGAHTGNVIIQDDKLRATFGATLKGLGLSPNAFGQHMIPAAYSPEGALWVDSLVQYLDENRQIFEAGLNAIPGVVSMPLEATYLAWVDFSGTGMDASEIRRRVQDSAHIAANYGETFGAGGESFLRFNIGAPKSRIRDAVTRLQTAFSDLQ